MTNEELKRLAEAALTEEADPGNARSRTVRRDGSLGFVRACDLGGSRREFMAAASPDVVLGLIAEVTRLKADRTALVEEIKGMRDDLLPSFGASDAYRILELERVLNAMGEGE